MRGEYTKSTAIEMRTRDWKKTMGGMRWERRSAQRDETTAATAPAR
jgi:hypothetical protein